MARIEGFHCSHACIEQQITYISLKFRWYWCLKFDTVESMGIRVEGIQWNPSILAIEIIGLIIEVAAFQGLNYTRVYAIGITNVWLLKRGACGHNSEGWNSEVLLYSNLCVCVHHKLTVKFAFLIYLKI